MPVIEAENLVRTYKTSTGTIRRRSLEVEAVRGVSFEVGEGELFGLLGPNGAGKTTTIKMLITLLIPTVGSARVLGLDVVKERARCASGSATSSAASAASTSGCRASTTCATSPSSTASRAREQRPRIDHLLELVGLKGREKERVEGYSRGMKQRLHVARGLLHDPPVVFLDEPTIGLDPVGARELRALIASLTEAGKTVLLTTHYMFEADAALRPHRRDRAGPDRRRGHAGEPQGAGRRAHGRRDRDLRRRRRGTSRSCGASAASRRSGSRTATRPSSCSSSRRRASS